MQIEINLLTARYFPGTSLKQTPQHIKVVQSQHGTHTLAGSQLTTPYFWRTSANAALAWHAGFHTHLMSHNRRFAKADAWWNHRTFSLRQRLLSLNAATQLDTFDVTSNCFVFVPKLKFPHPQMLSNVRYQTISCISHLQCGGFICTHRGGKKQWAASCQCPTKRHAALAAASQRSTTRQPASRCHAEKVSKEIKNRSTSEGPEPEQAVGTGNRNRRLWDGVDSEWLPLCCQIDKSHRSKNTMNHVPLVSTVAKCHDLLLHVQEASGHVEAKSVRLRAKKMHFLSTCTTLCLG